LLHLATSNTAPRHKKRVNGRVYVILINSEKLQTQTLVELAEELLTGGSRGLVGGVCVCICGVLTISEVYKSISKHVFINLSNKRDKNLYISRNRRRPESAEL
jgi:hypothetical protein